MKTEHRFTLMLKYCKACKMVTVHALSSTGSYWTCRCGEIIRIDTVSNQSASETEMK